MYGPVRRSSSPRSSAPVRAATRRVRDPSILRGPDGVFHLVWTVAWTDHGIGVAHSRDLIHWSEQARVPVMEHEPNALNSWAPDLFYDDATQQFVIVFASAIPGRFAATDSV